MDFDKETQLRVLRVAADRNEGKPVDEVDERISAVMDLHPEFNEIWKQGELATYPQEIGGQVVSPFVHTVLHVIVDRHHLVIETEFLFFEKHAVLVGRKISGVHLVGLPGFGCAAQEAPVRLGIDRLDQVRDEIGYDVAYRVPPGA